MELNCVLIEVKPQRVDKDTFLLPLPQITKIEASLSEVVGDHQKVAGNGSKGKKTKGVKKSVQKEEKLDDEEDEEDDEEEEEEEEGEEADEHMEESDGGV